MGIEDMVAIVRTELKGENRNYKDMEVSLEVI